MVDGAVYGTGKLRESLLKTVLKDYYHWMEQESEEELGYMPITYGNTTLRDPSDDTVNISGSELEVILRKIGESDSQERERKQKRKDPRY